MLNNRSIFRNRVRDCEKMFNILNNVNCRFTKDRWRRYAELNNEHMFGMLNTHKETLNESDNF